jgi:hypothetical protein
MNYDNVDIVIARYNENLSWTLETPFNEFKYIVYNKGDNEDFEKKNVKQIINLENVGRECHTYIKHIVDNYDRLSNVLVFFPGSIDIDYKKWKGIMTLNGIKNNHCEKAFFLCHYEKSGVLDLFSEFKISNWCSTDSANVAKNNESKLTLSKLRPFRKWFLHNFGNIGVQHYNYNSVISIDKRDILQHRKFRYEKFLDELSISSSPEVVHYMERSWGALFHPIRHTKIFVTLDKL